MFNKVLIANRGEIAIRIARTAHALGVATVAVYSTDDAQSLHVTYADENIALPGSGAAAYLSVDAVIAAARQAGCDAIHPGYGLLSESAELAQACVDNQIVFVGPSVSTLRSFGDKRSARTLAKSVGIPVIEGLDKVSSVADVTAFFHQQNQKPIMIKAVNGGGGRGMRVVTEAPEIESAFIRCQAESLAAFGSDDLYIERFLPAVRHIEVQIVGDGTEVLHCWERDCTIQRRNQKLLELAPAPNLNTDIRQALFDAAITIGKACNYKGLGTVEFLVATDGSDEFFFIETNPRIQVEHTITEAITGLDLVELQLRIASGEYLSDIGLTQHTVPRPQGYAIQARINTETLNAQGELVPTSGTLQQLQLPSGPGVRVDTYAYAGYRTNPNFDALLAKFVVHSRSDNVSLLLSLADRVLSEAHIAGVDTNISFLRRLLSLTDVQQWQVSVRGIESQLNTLLTDTDHGLIEKQRFIEDVNIAAVTTAEQLDLPEGIHAIRSPLSSVFVSFEIKAGETVSKGQELAVVEAMKMQHVIKAPCSGVVTELIAEVGATLNAEQVLLLIEEQGGGDYEVITEEVLDLDAIRPDLQKFRDRVALTLDQARPEGVAKRHSRGQRTARENLADLCDEHSFMEYGQMVFAAQRRKVDKDTLRRLSPADGIVAGFATINAELFGKDEHTTRAAVLSYDAMVMAGTQGLLGHKKTDRVLEVAANLKLPLVFFAEGGGGRPNDDDYDALVGACLDCRTFHSLGKYVGTGPKISVVSGFCFAGNAVVFGSGDFKIATRNAWIGMGGPAMVSGGGLGTFSPKDIGPAPEQAQNGLIDILVNDDAEAVKATQHLLSFFQGRVDHWQAPDQRVLRHIIPEERKRGYDMRALITGLADSDSWLEIRSAFSAGMITGFLRIEGRPLGIIANNPMHLGGAIDAQASEKASEFIRLCNRFKLPVLSLCDTPGFMVGPESEREGAVRWACHFVSAGSQVEVPFLVMCVRKAFGLGGQAMAGGSFATTQLTAAWPSGEFGMMGIEGGVELGYKKELDAETDPEKRQSLFNQLVDRAYEQGSAESVASLMELDAVIDPLDTRQWISSSLALANY